MRMRPLAPLAAPFLRRSSALALFGACYAACLYSPEMGAPSLAPFLFASGALVLPAWARDLLRQRVPWRLARAARRWGTVAWGPVRLHYHPAVARQELVGLLAVEVEAELRAVAKLFRRPPPGPVHVYLFESHVEVTAVNGWPPAGGFALGECRAVAVSLGPTLDGDLRHEFAHLFAHRVNPRAPVLLCEGIAVWAERAGGAGRVRARPLPRGAPPAVSSLLSLRAFHAADGREFRYALAGSFTVYLIARVGWDRYLKLYRRSTARNFARQVEAAAGAPLAAVEAGWRRSLGS